MHFAVDTESVLMTTRLAGTATHFLPFNKGCAGAAGNPPDPKGRTYRTAYLWEEVLQRDSLLDLLARFIHLQVDEKRDDRGRKVKTESMIFPRYHQLEAVRMLVDAARSDGVGHNYLVEHSAGSGKSNTIGWLTHRLSSLHDAANARVFDSVIVVTDRVVLDQQLQDTIYQFEHTLGVVQRIDERSRQLAEALENAVPVIITTLQKFPFVSRQLLKMAEERGTIGTGTLATRKCAVIVDEAHSSQGGETATDLKEVLGGEKLREEARKRAAEEGRKDLEELFRSMAKRGKQANLSFFAFTATPKHKTLAVFGRDGRPAHRYTMRQAIACCFRTPFMRLNRSARKTLTSESAFREFRRRVMPTLDGSERYAFAGFCSIYSYEKMRGSLRATPPSEATALPCRNTASRCAMSSVAGPCRNGARNSSSRSSADRPRHDAEPSRFIRTRRPSSVSPSSTSGAVDGGHSPDGGPAEATLRSDGILTCSSTARAAADSGRTSCAFF